MLKHSLILIFRNFKRNKSSFFINLIGLSSGLACALLIYLWVHDEKSVDKFHDKNGQIVQVLENVEQGGEIITRQSTSGPMADAMLREMPDVKRAVTTSTNRISDFILSHEDNAIKARGLYASADFFNVFSFEVISGNQNQLLNDEQSIVISESLASVLFGKNTDVVGKMLEWQNSIPYRITGVFRDIPSQSSMQFDFVLPFDIFKKDYPGVTSWANTGPQTYLLLRDGTNIRQFNKKIADFVRNKTNGIDNHRTPFVTQFSDNYLYGQYENGVQVGGRIEYVRLFSLIALFILFIACINFMNLSTAKASIRVKEVGIKKAVGINRSTLAYQYLGESILMALISMIIGVLLVIILLPQFNTITGKHLSIVPDLNFLLSLLFIVIVTGLVAGSYPAMYLSGFNPAVVLKGKLNTFAGEVWARKGLVVFQFALSIILIVGVLVVYKQIEFVQTKNLGYDKDHVLYFETEGRVKDNLETFLVEVRNMPGVIGASNIGHDMIGHVTSTWGVDWAGKNMEDRTEFENVSVNYGIIEMLNVPIKEGRAFSMEFGTDSDKIIFNEAAVEFMGLTNPVGKSVKLWGENREIIGVTENFHFESFHEKVKPLFFQLTNDGNNVMVKILAGREKETLSQLQEFYNDFNPGFPFAYKFLDQEYETLYKTEQKVSVLSRYFAGLAILISCLGLFGLAAFTAERRTKEIGIRKVLGSNEIEIIKLLSGDFTRMVNIAIVIAIPVSWWLAHRWLESFAYRIDLQWWFFAVAGVITLLVASLTVGMQTLKAALVNPVECLNEE